MRLLRHFTFMHRRALLGFVLAALGMQALVPAGLMVTPSPDHGAQIVLCPQTNPLARAVGARASAATAATHAVMGHEPISHATMDHAAMGHMPLPDDDPTPAPSAVYSAQSCAFAGASPLAGLLPDSPQPSAQLALAPAMAPLPLTRLRLLAADHLRPPLRAPPALI